MVCDHLPDVQTEGGWTPVPAEGAGTGGCSGSSSRRTSGGIAYSKPVSDTRSDPSFRVHRAGPQRGGQSLALAALRTESERTAVPLS